MPSGAGRVDLKRVEQIVDLARPAGRADHLVALELGDLAHGGADPARRRRDEHYIAVLQTRALEQPHIGGKPGHAGETEIRLLGQYAAIALLQCAGGGVEHFAPAQPRPDDVARLEAGIVGRQHFANRRALHRRVKFERRHVALGVAHATAHGRINRHPAIAHLHFARARRGHIDAGSFEIGQRRCTDGAADQAYFTRFGHVLSSAAD
jgi:hypothetical protein